MGQTILMPITESNIVVFLFIEAFTITTIKKKATIL